MKDKVSQYDLLEEMLNTVKQALRGVKENIKHQEKINDDHFDALNGEASRLKGMQETYLLKSTYETNISTQNDKFERALNQLNERFEATIREVRKDIKDVTDWKTTEFGRDKGKDVYTKFIQWGVTTLIAILVLVIVYLTYSNHSK